MGSSSSSTSSSSTDSNVEANESFNFRFTDCSCKCDASKRRIEDIHGHHDIPQAAFLTAFMAQMNRSQYDIRCDCDCGEGVKMGFLFGNTPSNTQQSSMTDNH
ncbi:unnamed protein product [Adineta steineri]|uniref:Uncharacterized protein n=1 Tax=Adineta steineri TaxID=433720 RepID=A0A815TKB1_9BILA|nr:unnamed protein product [Adineta steineri]CAF1504130.1 unnamed protein product [Adineta steineri]